MSREAVRQWRGRPGFPEPLGEVGRSVIWDWQSVAAWAQGTDHKLWDKGDRADD